MDFKTLRGYCSKEGYEFWADKGDYNLFIYGIRNKNGKVDRFDDTLGVAFKDRFGNEVVLEHTGTTDPGLTYLKERLGNKNGTAILCPGQYRNCWNIGLHGQSKQRALIQNYDPKKKDEDKFKVWRDRNKDGKVDAKGKVYTDVRGLNCHTVGNGATRVGAWSAGCQVRNDVGEHNVFMSLCEISESIFGAGFSYTLIEN